MKPTFMRLRGMQDILPSEGIKWNYVENVCKEIASLSGFEFLRTPLIEFTDLFCRSMGEGSDVVQKEMYSFVDKGNRNVSLRPEFTAGVLRAVLESWPDSKYSLKAQYFGPCFRYERPQLGRYREFFQFGIESFGIETVEADAEVIFVANSILKELKIHDYRLEINAVGCIKCRSFYRDIVKKFFFCHSDSFCETCNKRLNDNNPLRIFDCKEESCKSICASAPSTVQNVCDECQDNFEKLKSYLKLINISYSVNPKIVRGLDYYTKVVFEFIKSINGSDLTICGGGRYDELALNFNGKILPAVGFGMGVERIISLVNFDRVFKEKLDFCVFIALASQEVKGFALSIASELRLRKIKTIVEFFDKKLKTQLKILDKRNVKFLVVLGKQELETNFITIKNVLTSEIKKIGLNEDFFDFLEKNIK